MSLDVFSNVLLDGGLLRLEHVNAHCVDHIVCEGTQTNEFEVDILIAREKTSFMDWTLRRLVMQLRLVQFNVNFVFSEKAEDGGSSKYLSGISISVMRTFGSSNRKDSSLQLLVLHDCCGSIKSNFIRYETLAFLMVMSKGFQPLLSNCDHITMP